VKCDESPLNYLDRTVAIKASTIVVRCDLENMSVKNSLNIG